jgi:hypothetical protein
VIYLVNLSAVDFQRKKNKWLPKIHQWVQVSNNSGNPFCSLPFIKVERALLCGIA